MGTRRVFRTRRFTSTKERSTTGSTSRLQQPRPSHRRPFAQVDPKVKPYMDSGQLKTFEGATEFFPGFRSEPAYGHTAGLTVYILENGGEKVMFWGDVVNIALQVDDPDISLRFDSDAAAAAATRRKLLEDAATKGYIVAPDHLPFPGLGHIRKDGHAYAWVCLGSAENGEEPSLVRYSSALRAGIFKALGSIDPMVSRVTSAP